MTDRTRAKLEAMTPDDRALAEEVIARGATPERRAARIAAREAVEAEVRETGGITDTNGNFYPLKPHPSPGTTPLGLRLRSAREARGLSLDEVAKASGLGPSVVRQLESGEADPTVRTLNRYARAVGMTLVVDLAETARP